MNRRRRVIGAILGAMVAGPLTNTHAAQTVDVYKSADCGCCAKWVEHMRAHGFAVRAHDVSEPSIYRARFGVPESLGACHTATVAGYVLEGHVPAGDLKRLLSDRPKAKGIAVPAMPLGSPGMEGPRSDPFKVLLFDAKGRISVFASYS